MNTSSVVECRVPSIIKNTMPSRFAKQLIFGGTYLLVIFFVVYGFYLARLKPAPSCFDNKQNQGEEGTDCGGPCEACVIRSLTPLVASAPGVFNPGNHTATVFFSVRNENLDYGALVFSYTIRFLDRSGAEFFTTTKESFVYPASVKYIVEFDLPADPARIAQSSVTIEPGARWQIAELFSVPQLETRNIQARMDTVREQAVVTGEIVNNSAFAARRATVSVVIVNDLGLPVGASKTTVRDLEGLSSRAFQVVVPGIVEERIDERLIEPYLEGER